LVEEAAEIRPNDAESKVGGGIVDQAIEERTQEVLRKLAGSKRSVASGHACALTRGLV
jgi:hypothetical protein